MRTCEYARHAVQTDDDGFLLDGDQWTPEIGEEIARKLGIWPLTGEHWNVLTFCREDAAREGRPPGIRRIANLSGVGMKSLQRLFPGGAGRVAARIAGLPNDPGRARPGRKGDGLLQQALRSADHFSSGRRIRNEKGTGKEGRTP